MKNLLVTIPHVLRAAVLAAAVMPMALTQAAEISGAITSGTGGLSNTLVSAYGMPVSTNASLPIPDTGTVIATSIVSLPATTIGAMRVSVNISHTFRGDLQLTLIHPDGTE